MATQEEKKQAIISEIKELLKSKKVSFEESDIEHIEDAIDSFEVFMEGQAEDVENDRDEFERKYNDAMSELENIEDDDDIDFIEIFSNDKIRVERPSNMNDQFIIEALSTCLKSGKTNALLETLESFAKQHGVENLTY